MKLSYFVLLFVAMALMVSCVAPPPPPAAVPPPPPAPAPTPTPTPTEPTQPIPEEILASRFIINVIDADIEGVTKLGIRWAKPLANPHGPFIWGLIEREREKYIWQLTDRYIQKVQGYNMAFLAVIWPFAEWDQANWGPVADTEPLIFEEEGWVCRSRRKPYDMDAYRRFVSAAVERYDGDVACPPKRSPVIMLDWN